MSYYLVRVGEGSKYIDETREKGFVAIGWNEVSDLSKFKNANQIKKTLQGEGSLTPSEKDRAGLLLHLLDCIVGTDFHAGTAICAFILIDNEDGISFGNTFHRTFRGTVTASIAFVSNQVGHFYYPH